MLQLYYDCRLDLKLLIIQFMKIELRTQSKQILQTQSPIVSFSKGNLKKNYINKDIQLLNQFLEDAYTQIQHKNKLIQVLFNNAGISGIKSSYQTQICYLKDKIKNLQDQNQKLNMKLLLTQQIQTQNQQQHLFAITYYEEKIFQLRQSLINKQSLIHHFQKNTIQLGLGLFHDYEEVKVSNNQKYVRQSLEAYQRMIISANIKIKHLSRQLLSVKNSTNSTETVGGLNFNKRKQIQNQNQNQNQFASKQKINLNSVTKVKNKAQVNYFQISQAKQQSEKYQFSDDCQKLKNICFKTYQQNKQLKTYIYQIQQEKLKYKVKSESLLKSYLLLQTNLKALTTQIVAQRMDNQSLKNIIRNNQKLLQQKDKLHQTESKHQIKEKVNVVQLLQNLEKVKQRQKKLIKSLQEKQLSVLQEKSIMKTQLERSRQQFSRTIEFTKKKSMKIIQNQNSEIFEDGNFSIIDQKNSATKILQTKETIQPGLRQKEYCQKSKKQKYQIKGNYANILDEVTFQ